MKNTLKDLNNYLFESIETILDAETDEELDKAVKKGKAIKDISGAIINNANTQLHAVKLQIEYGRGAQIVPDNLLENRGEKSNGAN